MIAFAVFLVAVALLAGCAEQGGNMNDDVMP